MNKEFVITAAQISVLYYIANTFLEGEHRSQVYKILESAERAPTHAN